MAALILGCAGCFGQKIQRRREIKKANKNDFERNFEQMKAANLQRHSWIQSSSRRNSELPPQQGMFDPNAPPAYDDPMSRSQSAASSSTKDVTPVTSHYGTHEQRHDSTVYTPGDRIASRDMAMR